jgi:L-threonylcarbamoyladenylate synthase
MHEDKLVVRVDEERPDPKVIAQAARLIRDGVVLVVPTDTCYIFAVNALNTVATKLVYAIKNRPLDQPIHIAVRDLAMASEYVELNEWAILLASKFFPGPLTIVLPKKETIPDILVGGGKTVGIRIPANRILLELISTAGLPITATSANPSGSPTPYTVAEVLRQLGPQATGLKLALDQGPLPRIATSTIIDLSTSKPHILREGPIPGAELLKALGISE